MNNVGYRWNFMPTAWALGSKGTVENNGMKFMRFHNYTLFTSGCDLNTEETMRKLFKVKTPSQKIKGNSFRFVIPGKSLIHAVFLPADKFAGAAVWDTDDMPVATFEPFYQAMQIAPGGTVSFSFLLNAE